MRLSILLVVAAGCVHDVAPSAVAAPELRAPDMRAEDAEVRAITADPTRWRAALSGRGCAAVARRELARSSIAREQQLPVQDLAALHRWELELQAANDSEATAREALASRGVEPVPCSNPEAQLVARCLLAPAGWAEDPQGVCRTPRAEAAVRVALAR